MAPKKAPARRRPMVSKKMKNEHVVTPIGARFRAERLKLELHQYEFAEMLGVGPETLSRIELGDRQPTEEALKAFAKETSSDLAALKRLCTYSNGKAADVPVVAPLSVAARDVDEYAAFINQIDDLVPMPGDKSDRRAWFAAAKALWELR